MGVKKVWFWVRNEIKLSHLRDNSENQTAIADPETYGYEKIATSDLIANLDMALYEQCVTHFDPIQAIDEFEQGMG